MSTKPCKTCNEPKPLEAFPRARSTPDGLANVCRDCTLAREKAWRVANREHKKETDRKWREANADRKREKNRQWYFDNREHCLAKSQAYAEQNRDKTRASSKRWAERHPDKIMANLRKRQAAKQNRCGLLTPEKEAQIAALYAEAQRLTKETGTPHHVDHIVPLRGKTVSGLHIPENMRIIPASDNLKKGSKVDPSLALHGFTEAWF